MRKVSAALALVAGMGLAGCGLIPDITNTNINDNDNQNHAGGNGTPTPTATPSCAAQPVTCTRNENPQALASTFAIVHGCGEASSVLCARASDGLAASFDNVVTGSTLDPGAPGQGGGEWSCRVVGGGSCTVRLDS